MPDSFPFFSPRLWYGTLVMFFCALALAAPAQADPPGRIGRIAWMSGSGAVGLYNPDSGESYNAPLNHPLTSGDVLTTGPGSRAEIQIGSMTVRLDSNTVLDLSRIDDDQVRLSLIDGRTIARLPARDVVGDFELSTPIGRFRPNDAGIYRFDTDTSSASATVYYGGLHFESNDSALDIGAGQSAQFWPSAADGGRTRYRLLAVINDDFTQWSASRDRRPAPNTYSRYVSPEMTGAEDLDAYGNWSENAEYGAIWVPRSVPANWAPYRSGHWAWVAPWGWTWVDDQPWGFAPFHYGRWVQYRGIWGWVPGVRIARPAYSPAMVAWIGSPGMGVSLSFGARPAVGWFPLAPREVYVPAYRSSPEYIRRINVTHITNITNVTNIASNPQDFMRQNRYAYREHPRAVTFVPADVITHRRPVEAAALPPGNHWALREQPVRAAAPVAAPRVEGRNRHELREHEKQPLTGPERERQRPSTTPATAPANTLAATQRNERTLPEGWRPLPLTSPHESREPQAQERPTRREQPAMRPAQRETHLEVAPQAPPQRIERMVPESPRPTPQPQLRLDPPESRTQERALRRDEPTVRQAPRETRLEVAPQAMRPSTSVRPEPPAPIIRESRREAPRDASGPPGRQAETRPESRNPHQETLQRPDQPRQYNHEKSRQRRQEEEKH